MCDGLDRVLECVQTEHAGINTPGNSLKDVIIVQDLNISQIDKVLDRVCCMRVGM